MKMKNIILLISCFVLLSCQEEAEDPQVIPPFSDTIVVEQCDNTFETFYEKFITDSIFQISRIKFPLGGTYTDFNGDLAWTAEKWKLMTWNYKDELNNPDDSVSVIQTDSTFYFGTFCRDCGFSFWMEFEKLSGKWQLTSRQENNF